MRESIWGYAIVTLGILMIGVMWFISNVTKTDQHNYNLLRETVESAMYDAFDYGAYQIDGTIKINEEKFVESFIRRFAQNAELSNTYKIEIYDINEEPPKVSVKVSSTNSTSLVTGGDNIVFDFSIANSIDAILETTKEYVKWEEKREWIILW